MHKGHMSACVRVQQRLLQNFPDDVNLHNQLGISYLLQSQPTAAQLVFSDLLNRWPGNGLAQVSSTKYVTLIIFNDIKKY